MQGTALHLFGHFQLPFRRSEDPDRLRDTFGSSEAPVGNSEHPFSSLRGPFTRSESPLTCLENRAMRSGEPRYRWWKPGKSEK